MKIGITGRIGSGKSTIFSLLPKSEKKEIPDNSDIYSVKVHDDRLKKISEIFKPDKVVYPEILFSDLKALYDTHGKTNKDVLESLKKMDGIVYVIGLHKLCVSEVNFIKDIEDFRGELILSDLMIVEKRLETLAKEGKKDEEIKFLSKIRDMLNEGQKLSEVIFTDQELKNISGYAFLTLKPFFIVLNIDEENKEAAEKALEYCKQEKILCISILGQLENEILDLKEKDRADFMKDLEITELATPKLIHETYLMFDLITFYTYAGKEVKAWSIHKNSNILKAASMIHSDIEKGFIKAEIINYDEFMKLGADINAAKKAGKLRLEGKSYTVLDGDIITFRFNV